jgi:hypothetical protein
VTVRDHDGRLDTTNAQARTESKGTERHERHSVTNPQNGEGFRVTLSRGDASQRASQVQTRMKTMAVACLGVVADEPSKISTGFHKTVVASVIGKDR